MTWWLCVQYHVEDNFLCGVFLPLLKHVSEKSSWWLWKGICVNTGVRKAGDICASLTAMI